jgi:hypothetical protein
MATYTSIQGSAVQVLSADPSNPVDGQMWYNTTSGTLKTYNGSATQTVTAT